MKNFDNMCNRFSGDVYKKHKQTNTDSDVGRRRTMKKMMVIDYLKDFMILKMQNIILVMK